MVAAFATSEKRTVRAQGYDDSTNAACQKLFRALVRISNVSNRKPGYRLGFTLVGDKVIELLQACHVDCLCWCGIENASYAMRAGKTNCVVNGFKRNLELENDAVGGFQSLGGRIDIGWLQRVICSLHHQNAILPVRFHEDRSDAARQSFNLPDVCWIDSLLAEILDCGGAEHVAADSRHHEYLCPAQT